jgi:hypothetical protein
VQQKADLQWSWIAMDAKTRQAMAFYVGHRSRKSAKRFPRGWHSLWTDQEPGKGG